MRAFRGRRELEDANGWTRTMVSKTVAYTPQWHTQVKKAFEGSEHLSNLQSSHREKSKHKNSRQQSQYEKKLFTCVQNKKTTKSTLI